MPGTIAARRSGPLRHWGEDLRGHGLEAGRRHRVEPHCHQRRRRVVATLPQPDPQPAQGRPVSGARRGHGQHRPVPPGPQLDDAAPPHAVGVVSVDVGRDQPVGGEQLPARHRRLAAAAPVGSGEHDLKGQAWVRQRPVEAEPQAIAGLGTAAEDRHGSGPVGVDDRAVADLTDQPGEDRSRGEQVPLCLEDDLGPPGAGHGELGAGRHRHRVSRGRQQGEQDRGAADAGFPAGHAGDPEQLAAVLVAQPVGAREDRRSLLAEHPDQRFARVPRRRGRPVRGVAGAAAPDGRLDVRAGVGQQGREVGDRIGVRVRRQLAGAPPRRAHGRPLTVTDATAGSS